MNWDAIGAIGEIIGALAVVLSLVYLSIQIRTQNREARLASVHQTVAAQRESMRMFLEPHASEDFLKVIDSFEDADPAQQLRFTMMVMVALKANQGAYLQYLEKRLDEDFFEPFGAQLADMLANESVRVVWDLRGHQFDRRFRDYVDKGNVGLKLYP
jgi:hypothetical protein